MELSKFMRKVAVGPYYANSDACSEPNPGGEGLEVDSGDVEETVDFK